MLLPHNLRSHCLFIYLLVFLTPPVVAQETIRFIKRANAVQTNVLAPFSLSYARALSQQVVFLSTIRWWGIGPLTQYNHFVNASFEGRFFTSRLARLQAKPHPAGFFVSPYLKLRSLHYINEIGQGIGRALARDEVYIRSLGFGLTVGQQWVGRRGFLATVFVGGGALPRALSHYRHTMRYSTVTSDVGYDYYSMDFRIGAALGYAF